QGVLLGLGEAVDLVEEEHRRPAVHLPFPAGVLDHLPHVLDPCGDRGEFDEGASGSVRDHMRQGRLPDPGRAPQDHRGGSGPVSPTGFDELVERGSGEGQMLLSDHLGEGARAHPHSQGVQRPAGRAAGGTGEARTRRLLVRAIGEQIRLLAHQASASSSSDSKSTPASARWASVIGAGAWVSGSKPPPDFGKAMTSRIESTPASRDTMRSQPKAMPPCGGAPNLKASSRKPNFSVASCSVMPMILNTRSWTSRRWMRIEPPPISFPLHTMS